MTSVTTSFRDTLAALLAPRRLIPISVVVVPLLVAQVRYSQEHSALLIGALIAASFVLVAPALWRFLFPLEGARASWPIGIVIYAFTGLALVVGIGRIFPSFFGVGYTFLTTRPSMAVSVALFWVGGWGLARDVDLETNLRRANLRAIELEKEAEHAQLLALKNNLDPHFLFNTLNAIAEWCREDGETAERAILELSSMLRTVMTGIKETKWPLSKEIALSVALFDLHRIRDPQRFSYTRDYTSIPDIDVPPMVLLPVSENAMKHGPSAGNRGVVSLKIEERGRDVFVSITNPGEFSGPREGGSGLMIVQKRLRLTFGDRASFTIGNASGESRTSGNEKSTVATMKLPREKPKVVA